MLTDIAGIAVGHHTDAEAMTGCTVIRFPAGTVASGEVRGGAPATREFALLEPTRLVQRLDAVVLSGGSAFGLAAADGVCRDLAAEGVGFETVGGPVPIVVGMSLFDLAVGDGTVRPTAADGSTALAAASTGPHEVGAVGAGTGATIAKWRGPEHRRPGGLVTATATGPDGLLVSTLIAVNAFGEPGASARLVADGLRHQPPPSEKTSWNNTTIGVVVTNAVADKAACHLLAQAAHDGFSIGIQPTHTQADGDAVVAAATCQVDVPVALVRALVVEVVVAALATLGPALDPATTSAVAD